MEFDPTSEVELVVDTATQKAKNRLCMTRRRSMSCSRLAPTPQFDMCQLERLSRNRDAAQTPLGTINQSGSPMTDSTVLTSSRSSPASFTSMSRGSVLRRAPTLVTANSDRKSGRKGLAWLHPMAWMRKKRQPGGLATPSGVLVTSDLRNMDASAFGTEQVMKPTETFQ